MGVRIAGKWHEELPDPGGGTYSSMADYRGAVSGQNNGTGGGTAATNRAVVLPQSAGGGTIPVADVYQTVNGPRTTDQMLKELVSAGWNGAGDIRQVYARTTGGAVAPAAGSNGVGAFAGGGGATVPVNATNDPSGLLSQINAALGQFGAQASGVTQAELAEKKRQFDLTLQRQMEMWHLQGLPTLVIQQRAADLAEKEFESQRQLAQQAQALQAAGVTGVYNGSPTLAAQQQAFAQEAARAGLGLQYLQAASQLGGPENTFQSEAFYRGAAANPQIPAFLQSLQSNTRMPVFQATGPAPNVLSAGSIANRLTGGQANTAGVNPDAALAAIQGISTAGAQKLAPGALEQLTPDELAAFGSGLKAVGNSLPAFLQQYAASRLGQGSTNGALSLAA